jgi:hypothetical protein
VFGTLSAEVQAALELELQGYVKQGRALSHSAGTLLKLANDGLGNPLNAVDTSTKPIPATLPVFPIASFSGDWSVSWSTAPNTGVYTPAPGSWTWRQVDNKACGRYDFSGGGTSKGTVSVRTLTGESNDVGYGRSTFTMTLAKEGNSWAGTWQRGSLGGKWKGSRLGAPTRKC